ncbi:MAG: hypothetical protein ABSD49_12335 [Candidatus Bathyarchaeia archaeon]|jgi:hypothetical protein
MEKRNQVQHLIEWIISPGKADAFKNSATMVSIIILMIVFSTFLASRLGKNVWTSTLLMVLFGVIGITGLLKLRNPVIVELGAIGFVADIVWELYGTGNRLWGYYHSPFYMIGGTLPIEVAVLYFFLGMTAAVYALCRLKE